MNINTKHAMILGAGALVGTVAGRWATPRLGAALGFAFGPWGSVVGAAIGGVLGAALATTMVGEKVDLPTLHNLRAGPGLEPD